jgi:LacI family transcriptional regulator
MAANGKRRTTLKDIAAKTGYSINTISHALRDLPDISEATRNKIRRTARDMGYFNNTIAASLRSGHTNIIAIILGDISNLYYGITVLAMEKQASLYGYSTILLNTNEDDALERKAIETAISRNVDGILLSPADMSSGNIEFLKNSGAPFILFARYSDHVQTDYIVSDDCCGGYLATKHLIDRGHRDILLINGPQHNTSAFYREKGYRKALAEAGMPIRSELMYKVPPMGGGVGEVLDDVRRANIHHTAIFCYSDLVALKVMHELKERGCKIPEDISIVGFDFIQSDFKMPVSLTTVEIPKQALGEEAVDLLRKRITGELPDGEYVQKVCGVRLIDRHSVKKI